MITILRKLISWFLRRRKEIQEDNFKIVKKGELRENRKFAGTCSHCKTEVEFRENRGKVTFNPVFQIHVVCPQCQNNIYGKEIVN